MGNPFSLTGKTILVTGASSGIGAATAIACAGLGASVVLAARNLERLHSVALGLEGESHMAIPCDVDDDKSIGRLVDEIEKLDGLVCCAGRLATVPSRFVAESDLQGMFSTNFFSVVKLVALLQQRKKLQKKASIVLVSSVAALADAEPGNGVYSATKAALSAYGRVLATELAPRGIRVNSVAPGMVRTPFLRNFSISEEEMLENEKLYPLGFGEPCDVANAIVYLLSDASRWVTGSTLVIDGGLTLR